LKLEKDVDYFRIDKEQELERAAALIKEIKERKIKLLAMHIGGDARRGILSDLFLDAVIPYGDHIMIVESANMDNYFTLISKEKNIPLEMVDKILEAGELLKKIFSKIIDGVGNASPTKQKIFFLGSGYW